MFRTLHNLQALRGAACLSVIVYHIWIWGKAWYDASTPILQEVRWFGNGSLDVFFVLSGFLIPYTQAGQIGKPSEAPRFLLRRLWRVYPAYWVILACAVAG